MARPRPFLSYRPSGPSSAIMNGAVELPKEQAAQTCPEITAAFSIVKRSMLFQCSPASKRITVWADPRGACLKYGSHCGEKLERDARGNGDASDPCLDTIVPWCAKAAPPLVVDGEVSNSREYAALMIALGQLAVIAGKAPLFTEDDGTMQALLSMPLEEIQRRIASGEEVSDDLWRPVKLAAAAMHPQLLDRRLDLPPEMKAHLPDLHYLLEELSARFK